MTKPLAYSYIRMSTDIQLKGDSLRRQVKLSKDYAEKNELELVENFKLEDIGKSAFKGENLTSGALGEFLQSIEYGEIPKGSYLLVESLDRLSRQKANIALKLLQDITENGINVVTLTDNKLYEANNTDPMQMIYSILIMARANEESQMKSDRVSAAWKNKRDNIKNKILTKTCPAWLAVSEDRTKFIPISERVKTIQNIFEAGANGQGSGIITRNLNAENVQPFGKSNGWIESYVTKILKNRAVLGEFQPHHRVDGKRIPAGNLIEDYFPRIVEEDTFLKVQIGRRSRDKGAGSGRIGVKHKNLFSHLAKCNYCGSSMRFIDKGNGPKGGKYLKCSAAIRGLDCVTKSWRYSDFETSFFHFVREVDLTAIIERSKSRMEGAKIREQILIEEERLSSLTIKQGRTYNLIVESDVSDSFLKEKLAEISLEIKNIESKIPSLRNKLNSSQDTLANERNIPEQISLISQFNHSSNVEKRFLVAAKLKEFIKEIRIATDGKKPNFDRAKSKVEEGCDDPEEASKIIEILKDSHFNSPLSNPYFSISFYDGTERLVIPSLDDPTTLLQKAEVKKGKAFIVGGTDNPTYKLVTSSKGFPIALGPKKPPALKFEDGKFKSAESDEN